MMSDNKNRGVSPLQALGADWLRVHRLATAVILKFRTAPDDKLARDWVEKCLAFDAEFGDPVRFLRNLKDAIAAKGGGSSLVITSIAAVLDQAEPESTPEEWERLRTDGPGWGLKALSTLLGRNK